MVESTTSLATPLAHPIEKAAKRINTGRSKFYQLIRNGEIAIIKIGRKTLIAEDDLQDFLRRHRVQNASPSDSDAVRAQDNPPVRQIAHANMRRRASACRVQTSAALPRAPDKMRP
jgi:excisionase family DNA binding protein